MAASIPDPPEGNSTQNGRFALWSDFMARHRFRVNLVIHNALFALALLAAYFIWAEAFRSLGADVPWFTKQYLPQLPVFLLAKSLIFGGLKLFRGRWQHAGIRDLAKILLGSWLFLMVAYAVALVLVYVPPWFGRLPVFKHSNGMLVLDFMATVFLVGTARLGARLYHEEFRPFSTKAEGRAEVMPPADGHSDNDTKGTT